MTFDMTFDRLISIEGGYSNDPEDPGGETNWGISKREYPDLNIKTLTREEAKAIYLRDFWLYVDGAGFADSLIFQVFDFAVNSGIGTAIRYLQRAVGVADDGRWGPISKAALTAMDESDAVLLFTAERLDFMTRRKNWLHDGGGWVRRMAQNLRYGALDNKEQA